MKHPIYISSCLLAAGIGLFAPGISTQPAAAAEPYKILSTTQTMGTGGIDYVYADNDGRRLYVPRGTQILAFDLDTAKLVGTLTNTGGHGVAVDPKTHHGFSTSRQISMFDTQTLEVIKHIQVQGGPDGILFEPFTEQVYVLSHGEPNVTLLDPKDGSIAGTISLGGAPEQAASDGAGTVYIDLEDVNQIAVVDAKARTVKAHYDLGEKGAGPAGLGLDAKNKVLFAFCHSQNCVILSAADGKILTTLPIGNGVDGGGFNPNTMEAFSSQGRDSTLTIIKENSPTSFEVEQNVTTKPGAKTCTLDAKNNHIIVITTERAPAPAADAGAAATPPPAGGDQPGGGRRGGRGGGPGFLDIIVVGR